MFRLQNKCVSFSDFIHMLLPCGLYLDSESHDIVSRKMSIEWFNHGKS